MIKRTFHDLIEIKNGIEKLEKPKPDKSNKKRRRILTLSSSSEEEPSDTQLKIMKSKERPLPAAAPLEKVVGKCKSPAQPSSRRKTTNAKSSSGKKDRETKTGTQIQDKFWRNATGDLTIAMADLLMYLNHFLGIHQSNSQQDRQIDIT